MPEIRAYVCLLLTFMLLAGILPNVHASTIIASYSKTDTFYRFSNFNAFYQCFQTPISADYLIDFVTFNLSRSGNPSGMLEGAIYPVSGRFNSTCLPTGSALAISVARSVLSLGTNPTIQEFDFASQFKLLHGSIYAAALENQTGAVFSVSNDVKIYFNDVVPTSYSGVDGVRTGIAWATDGLCGGTPCDTFQFQVGATQTGAYNIAFILVSSVLPTFLFGILLIFAVKARSFAGAMLLLILVVIFALLIPYFFQVVNP